MFDQTHIVTSGPTAQLTTHHHDHDHDAHSLGKSFIDSHTHILTLRVTADMAMALLLSDTIDMSGG